MKLALLCSISGGDCDPDVLMERARCFSCLRESERNILRVQLLCEILTTVSNG